MTPSARTRFLTRGERFVHHASHRVRRCSGMLSIWADPLYEGAGSRRSHGRGTARRAFAPYFAGPGEEVDIDPVNDLRRWRATIEDHDSYDELILWFEHDLFDQLNLIQLLDWIRERLPAMKQVSLVCIGTFPGHSAFKGLGERTPDELASLLETRQRVGDSR